MEKNNASFRNNLEEGKALILQMEAQGIIQFTNNRPRCVNPLGLIIKEDAEGKRKVRLIFDASRCLNKHLDPKHVKLTHLERALQLTKKGDFQVVFDLQQAYYHVKIRPEDWTYLGACVELHGQPQFFVYKHLPFGLNVAVHTITKIWKPVTCYIQSLGIPFTIYIDDGRVLGSEHEIETNRRVVYDVLQKCGWLLSLEKNDAEGQASTSKEYLGFVVDSMAMKCYSTERKLAKVENELDKCLALPNLGIRDLASVVGKISSMRLSHGMLSRVCLRSAYMDMERHVASHGWVGNVVFSGQSRMELTHFREVCRERNGHGIESEYTDVRVDTFLSNPVCRQEAIGFQGQADAMAFSDSSAFKAAVSFFDGTLERFFQFTFTEEEKASSSGCRELLAILRFLQNIALETTFRDKHILWGTDSTNVVSFIEKGSGRPLIQKHVFDIVRHLHAKNNTLTVYHLYREDPRIQVVDNLSKTKDTDNWSVDYQTFKEFHEEFHFTIDLFADNVNKKLTRFSSLYWCEGTAGVDAFTMSWSNNVWICPPLGLLNRIHRRICSSKSKGVIIFPVWPASSFYCLFFGPNRQVNPPFKLIKFFQPYITQNEGATATPLFGKVKFDFVALYFST